LFPDHSAIYLVIVLSVVFTLPLKLARRLLLSPQFVPADVFLLSSGLIKSHVCQWNRIRARLLIVSLISLSLWFIQVSNPDLPYTLQLSPYAGYFSTLNVPCFRELNELRKPSTDNPEILRFFRYMKAAKDGQDGADCIKTYPGCLPSSAHSSVQPPMIKTYHDIDKLVQARGFGKSLVLLANNTNSTEHQLSQVNCAMLQGNTLPGCHFSCPTIWGEEG
jgi:hypothetical protein